MKFLLLIMSIFAMSQEEYDNLPYCDEVTVPDLVLPSAIESSSSMFMVDNHIDMDIDDDSSSSIFILDQHMDRNLEIAVLGSMFTSL